MTPTTRNLYAVVAAVTLLFTAALAVRLAASVWLSTGVAAVLSLALWWRAYGSAGALMLLAPDTASVERPDMSHGARPRSSLLAGIGLGVAAGVVMVFGTHAAFAVSARLVPELAGTVRARYAELQAWPGPLAAVPILVVIVLAEECVWRGALFDALPRHWSQAATLVAATILYALPQLVTLSPVVVAAGVAWWQFQLYQRGTLANQVSEVSQLAAVPGVETLRDFEAIQLLRIASQPDDLKLVAALDE